jgi:hypothetical protein
MPWHHQDYPYRRRTARLRGGMLHNMPPTHVCDEKTAKSPLDTPACGQNFQLTSRVSPTF